MKTLRPEDRSCPLSSALEYVGEWWTLLILHDAFDGFSRFDEFQQNIGLSSSMLSKRLSSLVESGILTRRKYSDRPVRHEYVLTELGRSLRPVVVALAAWTNSRLPADRRTMVLVDPQGREVDPVLVDRATGRPVDDPDEFRFQAGPAASPAMAARYSRRAQDERLERRGALPPV